MASVEQLYRETDPVKTHQLARLNPRQTADFMWPYRETDNDITSAISKRRERVPQRVASPNPASTEDGERTSYSFVVSAVSRV